mgnify:FL=1|jgi:hypothetical protein|nr:MAG TPA: DMP12 DNA mimic protein DMP12 [Caudoviricetes sp.]
MKKVHIKNTVKFIDKMIDWAYKLAVVGNFICDLLDRLELL